MIAYPDYEKAFRVYTDASHQGPGAVLSQVQEGQERVVAYASRGLKRTERNCNNYSTFKLELFALIWAVTEKCKDYLISSQFDNNPLAHLATAKLVAIEQRWVSRLANFRYTVAYRSGKANRNADALSRLPTTDLAEAESDGSEDNEMPSFNFRRKKRIATSEPDVTANESSDPQPIYTLGFDWKKVQRESAVL